MSEITIDVQAALEESARFNQALQRLCARTRELAGEPVPALPRQVIWQCDKVRLFRYGDGSGAPLLLVYALINRPGMLDLTPSRSLIRRLLELGVDVYLIDWGRPDAADRGLRLEDYIAGYLDACVSKVCDERNLSRVDLLGVCQGGVFSLCYTALFPSRVGRLVTMVTPVDFHAGSQPLLKMLARIDTEAIVRARGNIPGQWMRHLFTALQPLRLGQQKYVDLIAQAEDPERLLSFLRMESWINDGPDLAAAAFLEFVQDFIRDNGLALGTARVGARVVDLKQIKQPLLNIYASRDHLVPPASSKRLSELTASRDYRELSFAGGHIGIYVSRRSQAVIPAAIAEWLAPATETRREVD